MTFIQGLGLAYVASGRSVTLCASSWEADLGSYRPLS